MPNPLLLGHRGARAELSIPENTFRSFDRALQDGCDGFEFDVRLTADGHAVICHDAKYRGLAIAQSTKEQLPELLILDDVLARYAAKAFLDVELKVPGLEQRTASALRLHPAAHGCVVSSFLPEVLQQFRQCEKSIPLGFICDRRDSLVRWRELSVDYVIPKHTLLTRELLDQVHGEGKKLLVWTVNARSDMLRFAHWGVDGVISDDTRLLAGTLRGLPASEEFPRR
jgi:glycerophosphoryl diester phosphodiesterase